MHCVCVCLSVTYVLVVLIILFRRRREREKARCAAETAQEKEEWLRDRASSAAQNTEQRQVTLDRVRD